MQSDIARLASPLVVEALARAERLPAMPHAALEVLRISQNDKTGSAELAGAISFDPVLAAQVLRLANSALFGRREIPTLQRACSQLGFTEVKLMTLSLALKNAVPRIPNSRFDYSGYWQRSLLRAMAAKVLAQRTNPALSEEAFVVGLLARIGQLILASCLTEEYDRVLVLCEGAWPTQQDERTVLGFSNQELGAVLLRTWNLPPLIYGTVLFVDECDAIPRGFPEKTKTLAEISSVASLCEEVLCGTERQHAMTKLREQATLRGLDGKRLSELLLKVSQYAEDASQALNIEIGDEGRVLAALRDARAEALMETAMELQETVNASQPVSQALLNRGCAGLALKRTAAAN